MFCCPKYEGKVKCIYIEPHHNTGNEGGYATIMSTTSKSKNGWAKLLIRRMADAS